jgi:hypothetical protein
MAARAQRKKAFGISRLTALRWTQPLHAQIEVLDDVVLIMDNARMRLSNKGNNLHVHDIV